MKLYNISILIIFLLTAAATALSIIHINLGKMVMYDSNAEIFQNVLSEKQKDQLLGFYVGSLIISNIPLIICNALWLIASLFMLNKITNLMHSSYKH